MGLGHARPPSVVLCEQLRAMGTMIESRRDPKHHPLTLRPLSHVCLVSPMAPRRVMSDREGSEQRLNDWRGQQQSTM